MFIGPVWPSAFWLLYTFWAKENTTILYLCFSSHVALITKTDLIHMAVIFPLKVGNLNTGIMLIGSRLNAENLTGDCCRFTASAMFDNSLADVSVQKGPGQP